MLQFFLGLVFGGIGVWFAAAKGHREFFFKEKFALYRSLESAATSMHLHAYLFLVIESEEHQTKSRAFSETLLELSCQNGLLISEDVGNRIERLYGLCLDALQKEASKEDLKGAYRELLEQMRKELGLRHLSGITPLLLLSVSRRKQEQTQVAQKQKPAIDSKAEHQKKPGERTGERAIVQGEIGVS